MRRTLLLAATAAYLAAAEAAAGAPDSVGLSLAPARVAYGGELVASGAVVPAEAGVAVVLEVLASGSWSEIGTVLTDGTGAFAAAFQPAAGSVARARVPDGGAVSEEVAFAVVPRVKLKRGIGRAFIGARIKAVLAPGSYGKAVRITVSKGGRVAARRKARVVNGRLRLLVPTPGVGRFKVRLRFPAADGLAARTVKTKVRARARTLSVGASGADVRALHRRLRALRFHVPGSLSSFTAASYDSVVAFQKAFGLPRTGVVDRRTWSRLGTARPLRPRFARPTPHIEVDKTRQILMVVGRGQVTGVIPVSTGRTGNTPEGRFRILWKAPATSTWLGPAILYRTLTFHGNFAIHGYGSVPTYPASSGCVRVPIWAANWLYVQSPVGERVYVYR